MAEFPCARIPRRHSPRKQFAIYLSKNPLNLSNFIQFFRNSIILERTARRPHLTRIPLPSRHRKCGQMRAPAAVIHVGPGRRTRAAPSRYVKAGRRATSQDTSARLIHQDRKYGEMRSAPPKKAAAPPPARGDPPFQRVVEKPDPGSERRVPSRIRSVGQTYMSDISCDPYREGEKAGPHDMRPLRVKARLAREGIPIIELSTVGTGLRACPDFNHPAKGRPRRVVPTFRFAEVGRSDIYV